MSAPLPSHPGFEPLADAPGESGTPFLCGLCGCRFTHGGQVCAACPMSRGCDLVRCPNCGYQFPRSSRIVETFRQLSKYFRRIP